MPFPPDLMLWLALAPFAAAVIAPWVARKPQAGWLLALVPAGLFAALASLVPGVAAGHVLTVGVNWAPSLGIRYAQRIDGLSLTFALLVTFIGTFIVIYAGRYLAGDRHLGRFMAFLLAFMGAMLGLVLADDFVTLVVFYELTAITSFLLIGFDHTREPARRAAVQALVVTGGGGLALLAGVILVRVVSGETSITGLLAAPDVLRQSPAYVAIVVLVCLAAFTKSAQFPFHFWLPNAMEAPTPVSAYLHSATMVKAGIFVLMRFAPVLGGTGLWVTLLPVVGGITFLFGAAIALKEDDLKQILAWTTVASLGLLVLLIGVGTPFALAGAALYLVAHALFKGALFMVAGAVEHVTGSRDVTTLAGLARTMPLTFVAAALACLSMAGLPPLIGFVAKEALYEGLGTAGVVVVAVAVAGNAMMFAVAAIVIAPFLRLGPVAAAATAGEGEGEDAAPRRGSPPVTEASLTLWLGPLILGAAALAAGLALNFTAGTLITPLASAVAGTPIAPPLHLWPTEFSSALTLTLVTIALGAGLFVAGGARRRLAVLLSSPWGADRVFDVAMAKLLRVAVVVADVVQPGLMRRYVALTFVMLAAALLVPLGVDGLPDFAIPDGFARPHYFVVIGVAVAGLAIVVVARRRLIAIVSLGVQGVMVALLFMLFGAPDLSFTQFMIETLSVVVLALVMTRLDVAAGAHRSRRRVVADGALALACGAGFAILLYGVVGLPFDPRLGDFYLANAYDIAHGRNVVNVIIVDFRGFDTLGEIAVVMAVGLAVVALVSAARGRPVGRAARSAEPSEAPRGVPFRSATEAVR